jgi:hypothetical protein
MKVIKQIVANMLNYPGWKDMKRLFFKKGIEMDSIELKYAIAPLFELLSTGIQGTDDTLTDEELMEGKPDTFKEKSITTVKESWMKAGQKMSEVVDDSIEKASNKIKKIQDNRAVNKQSDDV